MVETNTHRRFVGNVCLYRELAVREPSTFLRRNLDQVLDAHERLLRQSVIKETTTTLGGDSHRVMITSERSLIDWNESTSTQMLQELIKGRRPVLRIDALQLRLLNSGDSTSWRSTRRRSREDASTPSWLPDPDVEFRVPCRVIVSVSDARSPKRVFYTQPQSAAAICRNDDGESPFYDVELDCPFLIELDKLFVVQESNGNGFRHWKRTVTLDYILEVSIQCQDSHDTATLFSRLESRDLSGYPGVPADEGAIKATWKDLPSCPRTGTLLPLRRPKGHKSIEMKYGLDISMGWSKRSDTPLVALNRMRIRDASQQLPTPSASDDMEIVEKQVKVDYEFNEGLQTRVHTANDLCCIFCAGRRDYISASRLLLHYKLSHEHFHFESSRRHNVEGHQQISIMITLADKPAIQQTVGDSKNPVQHDWVAPQRPFDISAHIGGDERWTGGSRGKAPVKRGRPPKGRTVEQMDGSSISAQYARSRILPPLRNRENLAEVRDLLPSVRKMHTAPVVPGVRFYHTHSKQPVQIGEMVGDDEDEDTDIRLAQSQRRNMREAGLSNVEVEFHQAFNLHLDTEQSASRTLTRDGLVRFERKYRGKLVAEWRKPYEDKLQHLHSHGVIAKDILELCLRRDRGEEEGNEDAGKSCGVSRDTTDHAQQDNVDVEMTDAPTQSEERATENDVTGMPRANGKFAKRNDGTSAQGTPIRARKPHRWSGGGADRDIITNGLKELFPDSSPQPSLAQDAASGTSAKNKGRPASNTPTPLLSSRSMKHPRMRYEGGEFRTVDDSETPDLAVGLLRPNGATPASSTDVKRKRSALKGRCVCGELVFGGRGCVACDDLECTRGDFHAVCVGLQRPSLGWKCAECSGT